MTDSMIAEPVETIVPDLADAVESFWANEPDWRPISDYQGGSALFRSEAPARVFYGERRDAAFIQFRDDDTADASLERPWHGADPVDFVQVSQEVAIAYMML